MASSPSSSSLPTTWKYHVFPSFHGRDVRRGFHAFLVKELKSKGIKTFVDNIDIRKGKSLTPELVSAIEGSKIAIVIFSKNYATSGWCLQELMKIKSCIQTVMTVFYEVDPSDVRHQTGAFGEGFNRTCKKKTDDTEEGRKKVQEWREALEAMGNIAGEHTDNWPVDTEMIEKITTDVSNTLKNSTPSRDFDRLIGMEAHMKEMESRLCLKSNEVRMIGILGPPGIGKTTIARYVFNKHFKVFELTTIMDDIKARFPGPYSGVNRAKLNLQRALLAQILKQKDIEIDHLGAAPDRLKHNKVFIVLDDVDCVEQLQALAESSDWFGPGSRIIITTELKSVLEKHEINHIYKVELPNDKEALEIFCMNAFGQTTPYDGFERLSRKVTRLVDKLPLGLEVMGSHFKLMSEEKWEKALPRLKSRLDKKVHTILKFSYDALDDDEKDLFLHISCFSNGGWIVTLEEYLSNSLLSSGLEVLAEKSLLSTHSGQIHIHNLLLQLGKDINRELSADQPGKRKYLDDASDTCDVLTDGTGTEAVIGINLNLCEIEDDINISKKAFKRMCNLQYLKFYYQHDSGIRYKLSLPEGLDSLSRKLRVLHWEYFPLTCLPSKFSPKFLVRLHMPFSKLEKLWEGSQPLKNLKWMSLKSSKYLKMLPDLSTATNLEDLDLSDCSQLVNLPSSIGNATNLQRLRLNFCSNLKDIPATFGDVIGLQELHLMGCTSLVNLPSFTRNATNLKKLYLTDCTSLLNLPFSIGNATNLQILCLIGCSSLVDLPSSIGNVTNLQNLSLSDCSRLVELPSTLWNVTNLQSLYLSGCSSLKKLPSSIENATNLQVLNLPGCSSLVDLPLSIGNATSLMYLSLRDCSRLEELPFSIGNAPNLQILDLTGCSSLRELPLSVGNTTNLQKLDLTGCSWLRELPVSIGNATSLQKLCLMDCRSFMNLPSSIENAVNLLELNLTGCSSLEELPFSIGNSPNLQKLDLTDCSNLRELSLSTGNATNLQILDLTGCSRLRELSLSIENATNMQKLDLTGCSSLRQLPFSIGNATNLQELHLRDCSGLEELPSSIENLHKLYYLSLRGCSNLMTLPVGINMKSLYTLDLTDCSKLKTFPEISTNIGELKLSRTAIEEVPSSVRYWTTLNSVKEFPRKSIGTILYVRLGDPETEYTPPCVIEELPQLRVLELNGCKNLVSLPQLPDSLHSLYAEDCESLERLHCSFNNSEIYLNFGNCWKLNEEARELIIQTSTSGNVVLPSLEQLPAYFTYQDFGGSLRVKLDKRPQSTYLRFKVCVLLVNSEYEAVDGTLTQIFYSINQNGLDVPCRSRDLIMCFPLMDHLYIFEVEAKVTSADLMFEFSVGSEEWEIEACGVRELMEFNLSDLESYWEGRSITPEDLCT